MPLGPVEYLRSRGHNLYPGQSLALKLMYGEPLDNTLRVFDIRSREHLGLVDNLTEGQYFRYLSQQGRSNSASGIPNPEGYRRVLLAMGRRSGKTHLITLMHVYEAYRRGYGGPYTSMTLGYNLDSARLMARDFRDTVSLDRLISAETPTAVVCGEGSNRTSFYFQDIHLHRGSGARLYNSLAFDEPAYSNMGERSQGLDIPLQRSGRVLLVSTPNGHDPFFHRQCTLAQSMDDSLVLQMPTWEANPQVLPYLVQELSSRVATGSSGDFFDRDYGASFNAVSYQNASIDGAWVVEFVDEPNPEVELSEQGPLKSRFHIIEEFSNA